MEFPRGTVHKTTDAEGNTTTSTLIFTVLENKAFQDAIDYSKAQGENELMTGKDILDFHNRIWGTVPRIGQRIIKTSIAVFICLVINHFRGYEASTMSMEAAFTAIICMQRNVKGTSHNAISRFAGTLIGAAWSMIFLFPLVRIYPYCHVIFCYALIALGVLLSIYTAVFFHLSETAALAAIVFLCITPSFMDLENPLLQSLSRLEDIVIGTIVAILVNGFFIPRRKHLDYLFFIRTKDLGPDYFSKLSPSVIYHLSKLYSEGAKVCLITEHAPAFLSLQMNMISSTIPQIVMDGAAIHDANEDVYLWKAPFEADQATEVEKLLDGKGLSFFIYTIHNDNTCVFHHGEMNDSEKIVYDKLKKTPYRQYMKEDTFHEEEVVYFKIIDSTQNIGKLETKLSSLLPAEYTRMVRRSDGGIKGVSELYIYNINATVDNAKKQFITLIQNGKTNLIPLDITLPEGYRYGNDAIHLLNLVSRKFEQLFILPDKTKKQ